jgi:branched-chain amino acid transport system substrate-binding protein
MKIGLLLPRSILYPSMAFDLVDGLKESLRKIGLLDTFEIVSVNIGVAGKNEEIYAHCEQLLLQGVDVVVGYINPLSAEYLNPLFTASGKFLLVWDSGYHFPTFQGKLRNTYFISLQGSLSCRAVAAKAVNDRYMDFAFASSFFDAGYRPAYVYASAAEHHGGRITYNFVAPLKKSEFDLSGLTTHLNQYQQTAVLASFNGDMAEDFFRETAKNASEHPYAIYGAGFMAEELWLDKIPYIGYDWDSCVPWSITINTPENIEFMDTMKTIHVDKANIFALLGWETALFINELKEGKSLEGITIRSPRGEVTILEENGFSVAPLYYAKVVKNESNGNSSLTQLSPVFDLDLERNYLKQDIAYIQNTASNSWLNAYPCLES